MTTQANTTPAPAIVNTVRTMQAEISRLRSEIRRLHRLCNPTTAWAYPEAFADAFNGAEDARARMERVKVDMVRAVVESMPVTLTPDTMARKHWGQNRLRVAEQAMISAFPAYFEGLTGRAPAPAELETARDCVHAIGDAYEYARG